MAQDADLTELRQLSCPVRCLLSPGHLLQTLQLVHVPVLLHAASLLNLTEGGL